MPCQPWATNADAKPPLDPADFAADSPETTLLDACMLIASDMLHGLTGGAYPGICHDVVRPVARWREGSGMPRWWQATGGGARYGYCSCNRSSDFGCASMPQIRLPGVPILWDDDHPIVVKVDGVPLSDGAITVIDRRFLVRTDGVGWPCCQDLTKPDDEDGTWSVDYYFGAAPPAAAAMMASMLGTHIYLAMTPDTSSLSQLSTERLRSISRQGETLTFADTDKLYETGMTGVGVVDLWLMSQRMKAQRRGARVLVPGRGRQTRRRA